MERPPNSGTTSNVTTTEQEHSRSSPKISTAGEAPTTNEPRGDTATGSGKAFRLNARRLFLTYPKCPITKEECLAQLSIALQPETWIIARELHADGEPHLHCLLERSQAWNIRDPRKLDLVDPHGRYHGNYQTCRSRMKVACYVAKELDWISNLTPEDMQAMQTKNAEISRRDGGAYTAARTAMRTQGLRAAMQVLEEEEKTVSDDKAFHKRCQHYRNKYMLVYL